jgi:hypothetical protein
MFLRSARGDTSYIINFVTGVPFHIVILLVIQRLKQTKTSVVSDQSSSCPASYLILQNVLFKVYFTQLSIFVFYRASAELMSKKIKEGT